MSGKAVFAFLKKGATLALGTGADSRALSASALLRTGAPLLPFRPAFWNRENIQIFNLRSGRVAAISYWRLFRILNNLNPATPK